MFETQLGAKGQDTDSGTFKSLEKKGIRENSNDEKIFHSGHETRGICLLKLIGCSVSRQYYISSHFTQQTEYATCRSATAWATSQSKCPKSKCRMQDTRWSARAFLLPWQGFFDFQNIVLFSKGIFSHSLKIFPGKNYIHYFCSYWVVGNIKIPGSSVPICYSFETYKRVSL